MATLGSQDRLLRSVLIISLLLGLYGDPYPVVLRPVIGPILSMQTPHSFKPSIVVLAFSLHVSFYLGVGENQEFYNIQ